MYRAIILLLLSGYVSAHQWTPTYPSLSLSYIPRVVVTQMELFNTRSDIEYYELGVFDKNWNTVPFASPARIIQVGHLKREKVDIFIREIDLDRALYICSESKIQKGNKQASSVSSRICSKLQ